MFYGSPYVCLMEKELTQIINAITRPYPAHLHKDLIQECWLVALERLESFDPDKGVLFSFMYSRLNGHCRNWIKKNITPYTALTPDC